MRLTQLKLAGFKSFVDATAIDVPGNLVGVVGPNGCGKSNIIDAVRWVLGESRASALRGDSMQDVIFNGSSNRDAVARASVELTFDNRWGRAAGMWSQYAEIAVRRVLQRDGESSYFINNTHVRRRDVQDIFLGTGLGPRAYAIIEQGMISRIIEAKPEDLRVFLEEAAGISKYKERRRETEHRLADTRENLARVNDIREELGSQIERLEAQAEIARQFQELASERQQKQNLLALLRRNDARADAERHLRDIERIGIELEAETARLRELERELEQARSDHYAAADAVSAAQGDLYQANAEVSRLESEIRFVTDTRQRVEAQLAQGRTQQETGERHARELREADSMWRSRIEEARQRLIGARERSEHESSQLPGAEQAYRSAQEGVQACRAAIAQAEQALNLELTHAAHARKNVLALEERGARLTAERDELALPDAELLSELERNLEQSRAEIARQQALLVQVGEALSQVERERAACRERVQVLERELSAQNAKLLTLQQVQRHADENRNIEPWLKQHGLTQVQRLWQRIHVEPGWETAVESVLRERLHALEIADRNQLESLLQDPPPGRASLYLNETCFSEPPLEGLKPLAHLVSCADHGHAAIRGWLAGCYAVEGIPPLELRLGLNPRAVLVNQAGHQFSRYGSNFHAPDSADSGILARQREIEAIEHQIEATRLQIEHARSNLAALDARAEEHARGVTTLRAAGNALKQRHHEHELEQVRRLEERERCSQRSAQIELELSEIGRHREGESASCVKAEAAAERLRADQPRLQEEETQAGSAFAAAERALAKQRDQVQQAQREVQSAEFSERECINKLKEIESSIKVVYEQSAELVRQLSKYEEELASLRDAGLREQLQAALEIRTERERTLGQVRARQEELSEKLRAGDETRMEVEQKLQPLRDRMGDLRLKEQAARLSFEQYAAQLAEAGADEAALTPLLKGQRPGPLQSDISRIGNAITELGAINMAALEELTTSRERKQYLDAQSTDLAEALDILDNAIRRIDRETRELLQTTFDTVNGHFGELFPALFGGGDARLEMTGEEVLDAGVQVIARPPGKKNTSIHLLSGGEKALTAISLVFAMFQLNPAPFCLLDEVDAPLDDSNTERFCGLVRKMSEHTQFLFISHNKLTMEMANQLVGVTMQEQGVSRVVAVDIDEALKLREPIAA